MKLCTVIDISFNSQGLSYTFKRGRSVKYRYAREKFHVYTGEVTGIPGRNVMTQPSVYTFYKIRVTEFRMNFEEGEVRQIRELFLTIKVIAEAFVK